MKPEAKKEVSKFTHIKYNLDTEIKAYYSLLTKLRSHVWLFTHDTILDENHPIYESADEGIIGALEGSIALLHTYNTTLTELCDELDTIV